MNTLTKNKGILGAVAIFIVVMFLYSSFFKSDSALYTDEAAASAIGDDLVATFNNLQKVTLDQSVFSSKGYLLLTDFSVDVPQQPTGRPNPFNLIGRD